MDGNSGSTTWQEPGYVEPPRTRDGANHMMTDYDQAKRMEVFKDRRSK